MFDEKKYEESFRTLLESINQEMAQKCEVERNHWIIPHGSLIVEIRLSPDGWVEFSAPFVKLSPERRAAPMRLSVELNTYNLRLSKLLLDGDGLYFHCRIPLELVDPNKVYGIVSEICLCGDSYDDEYISKFGAHSLREREVTPLPQKQLDGALSWDEAGMLAWNSFQKIMDPAFE